MKYRLTKSYRSLKGLTLLETLVSITIITLAIIGPLSYMVTSSSYAKQTKEAMTASYLAEEAVELLQNRYDSLYVLCNKQPGIDPCITATGETVGQIAWRVFKEKFLAGGGYPSCFADNVSGCAFDYVDMQDPLSSFPPRYLPAEADCSSLIGVSSSTYYSYVCKGVPSHKDGQETSNSYRRVVYLEQLPTFENNPANEQDNDDIRITVEVEYKSASGAVRNARVTRFMHPRP